MQDKTNAVRKLRIPGIVHVDDLQRPEIEAPKTLGIQKSASYVVSAMRSGDADSPTHDYDPDEVVIIALENGTRLITTSERLCAAILKSGAKREADGVYDLSPTLPLYGAARGMIGSLVIKTLKFFQIDVPGQAAMTLAELWENHTLGKSERGPGPGLRRCATGDRFELGDLVAPSDIAPDRPLLLFLHGMASTTEGSFGKLWDPQAEKKAIREALFAPYQNHVFGFEHHSLSQSPVHNAIALLKQLPAGARLHLVSHSRGGLIGELLCRAQMSEGRDPFDELDFALFKKDDPKADRGSLEVLNSLLKEKRIQVARFVRVACPAWGTTLASERFDIYLSLVFSLIEKIPVFQAGPGKVAFDIFTELLMAIARERANPAVLPGIEAMIPGSALVRMLNRPDRLVDGELRIIAGDIAGANTWSLLGTLLTDPLYLDDHDLVVNTSAMFGGAERKGGAAFRFYQGKEVTHFHYFENADNLRDLAQAITRPAGKKDDFTPYIVRKTDAGEPPYRREGGPPKPIVFLVPGIMGSHLEVGRNRIWLDFVDLAFGGMSKLKMTAQAVRAECPVWTVYADITRFLARTHEVVPFAFDWRLSLEIEALRLAEAITRKLDESEKHDQPVSILAHSMGGLVARAMIATPEGGTVWERMCRHPEARLIMLGTPNGGAYCVPLVLTGRDTLIKKLALLDFVNNKKELLEIVSEFPGFLEMMPVHGTLDLFSAEGWEQIRKSDQDAGAWPLPKKQRLAAAKKVRDTIFKNEKTVDPQRMLYVAGHAPATPVDIVISQGKKSTRDIAFLATSQGDGRVPWATGMLPGVKTWYMDAAHGDLPNHREAFDAILDLLEKGATNRLPITPPVTRGLPELFEMPVEKTPLFPDQEDLARIALGAKKAVQKEKAHRAEVTVAHGNLAYANHPIMVGHYAGDTIVSAEAHLNRVLGGRLADLHSLGLYPGKEDTAEVFLNPHKKPAGAVVIGLGEVGSLSPGRLMQAVSRGTRMYAKTQWDQAIREKAGGSTRVSAKMACLLVGTGAGGIGVGDALTAILRGIAHANQNLEENKFADRVRIDAVEFLELYEDRAILAAQALARISRNTDIASSFNIDPELEIRCLPGGCKRACFAEEPPWWQRLEIVEDKQERLRFNLLTDRARAEVHLQPTQRQLVDLFIDDAIVRATAFEDEVAVTLFEMLVPNELKEYAPERRDIVLVLNDGSARYPWELMKERPAGARMASGWAPKPLAIQAGMVRQLQTGDYRERVVMALGETALVVGDPPSNFPPLSGAEKEAGEVVRTLEGRGYQVTALIGKSAKDILREVYVRDYRILHLAGHGVYNYDPEKKKVICDVCGSETRGKGISGMVIGKNQFLTPALIRQMRAVPEMVFVNCCHLGKIEKEDDRPPNHPPKLAANLGKELINMGVRAVVAAGWAVDDAAAQTFASEFYSKMLSGIPFGAAVLHARQVIYANYPHVNTWGAYQCYGDPAFSLVRKGAVPMHQEAKLSFNAPAEAVVALGNIAGQAASASDSEIAALRESVQRIVQILPKKWLGAGEVRAALGHACGELDLFAEAVTHYRYLLQIEKAQFPFLAIEQLFDLQTRWAVAQEDVRTSKALIKESEKKIQQMIDTLGPTAERESLLGSAAKRSAMIAESLDEKKVALGRMAEKYKAACGIQGEKGKSGFYALLNWLTAGVLLELLGDTSHKPDDFKVLLEKAAEGATASHREAPDFWSAITAVDCRLLEHLEKRDLALYTEQIAAAYLEIKQRIGSPREFRSVLEHIEFLKNIVDAPPEATLESEMGNALLEIRRRVDG